MGILRIVFGFIVCAPLLCALTTQEEITKSLNVQSSNKSKYKVNNFTNINLKSSKKIEEQPEKTPPKETPPKKEQDSKPKSKDIQTPPKPLTNDYESKLRYLQSLRYEVMSLKAQLGEHERASVPYGQYLEKNISAQRFNALTQSYNDALKKSGLFAGVGMGVLDVYTSGYRNNALVVTRITPLVYGGSGGYQKFFNHYVGTRLYGGAFTSFFQDVYTYNVQNGQSAVVPNPFGGAGNLQSFYALAFMSADLLFEFPLNHTFQHYIGGFAGLNIGIMYYRTYATHPQLGSYYPASFIWNYNLQVDYSFNLGVSLTLYNKHRVELGLGIPFSYLTLPGFAESANILETIPAQFWRSAVMMVNYKMLMKF